MTPEQAQAEYDAEVEAIFGLPLPPLPRIGGPKAKPRRTLRPEDALQIAVAKWLRWAIAPAGVCDRHGQVWYAIEQARDKKVTTYNKRTGRKYDPAGQRNQAKGVRAGAPDLDFYRQGRAYKIELKAGRNDTSGAQDERHEQLSRAGIPTKVCWSLEQVEAALRGWGFVLSVVP